MSFDGFPRETVTFLKDLKANNEKPWFEANRDAYEQYFVQPAIGLIGALSGVAEKLDPPHKAEAKMNGSLRRIHRDVRFSKDKTPYNPHLHLIFWTGGHPNRSAGIHLVMTPDGFGYGSGHWAFDGDALERYRANVLDAKKRTQLEKALAGAEAVGCTLDEPALKKVPRGFDPDEKGADYLRHKGLVARTHGERGFDERLFSAECVAYCAGIMKALAPLNAWVSTHVEHD